MAVEDQRAAGSTFFRQADEAVHGMIRILRAKPSTQDQQQPVELRRAALEVKPLAGDCDSRELVGGTVFPQVEIDYSVWHVASCL